MENKILDELAKLGVDKTEISTADLNKLMQGKVSDLLNFSVPDNSAVRDFLDKENVQYTTENGKVKFSAKVKQETINEVEDTEKNRQILDEAKISYESVPGKQRLRWVASNAMILGVGVINPMIGAIALTYNTYRLIAKKINIENSYNLSNPDMSSLKKGEIVMSTDSFGRNVLRQLDKDTNTIMSARVDSIRIPDTIFGNDLTDRQKKTLKAGGTIKIKDEKGDVQKIRLDLVNETGLASLKRRNNRSEVEKQHFGFKM